LVLARRQWLRQQALANEVQKFSSLAELLKIDMATKAYASFVAAEFSGEALAFYLRVRAFKNNGTTLMVTTSTAAKGTDVDRILLLSQPATGTGAGTGTSKTPKKKMSPAQRLLKEANQINTSFVVDDAPFEVNLSAVVKSKIANQLQQLTIAVAASQREKHAAIGGIASSGNVVVDVNSSAATIAAGSGTSDADLMLIQSILNVYDEASIDILQLMQTNRYVLLFPLPNSSPIIVYVGQRRSCLFVSDCIFSYQRFRGSSAFKRLVIDLQQQQQTRDHSTEDVVAVAVGAVALSNSKNNDRDRGSPGPGVGSATTPVAVNAWALPSSQAHGKLGLQTGSGFRSAPFSNASHGTRPNEQQSLLLLEPSAGSAAIPIGDTGHQRRDSIASSMMPSHSPAKVGGLLMHNSNNNGDGGGSPIHSSPVSGSASHINDNNESPHLPGTIEQPSLMGDASHVNHINADNAGLVSPD
jgi:hypothetical protein